MADVERRVWTRRRRFEFLEWKLFWDGQLNRKDLELAFDISTPQASIDLKNYREIAPKNLGYDPTAKAFVAAREVIPKFLAPSADRLLLQLRALLVGALPRKDVWFRDLPEVDMVPDVARHVDAACLRQILAAMRAGRALRVHYQSLTNSRWRDIAPHALAFDGLRWHVRAWACDRGDFRDFVLSRMAEVGESEPASFNPADDLEWHTRTVLRLEPHPGLSGAQRDAIARDFDMTDGRRDIEVRLSMAYYFIKRMNLDLPELPPERVQLVLSNLNEVQRQVEEARIDARRRATTR